MKEIEIRHHLFHRNGKDKDGNKLNIQNDDLNNIIKEIWEFIEMIEENLNEKLLE